MLATMWDRFTEDPLGFLLLGACIAVVFIALERLLRVLIRRREMEEDRFPHRTVNQLPRTFESDGAAAVVKLEDDVQQGETVTQ